jgi:hypothetical protein
MNVDYSFIRLTKNDFEVAKKGENPNVATLIYDGFIMQLPNETFTQRSNNDDGIAFAGGIVVDLIDKCGNLVQNIDSNFYYTSFVDDNGVNQISFEFGMIGQNYFTMPLYLRITDSINGNVYYSNGFLVTDYYKDLSTRFDYKNANDTIIKSVRISNCFHDTQVNKFDLKSYTTTKGFQTSYRQIPTYLQKYTIETLDFFANNRLVDLFSHSVIYVNGMRCSISDYNTEDRKGTTNIMSAEFTINPLNDLFNWSYQIYQGLNIVSMFPIIGSTITANSIWTLGLSNNVEIFYNKNANLRSGANAKLYYNGTLTETITTPINYQLNDNILYLEFNYFNAPLITDILNGNYEIKITNTDITSGIENPSVINWTFTIANGEYDNTNYDNSQYLTN